VPDVVDFDARPFEGRFYVQILSLEALKESSALPVESGDYVLLPRVVDHPERSWERRAEQIERVFKGVEPLVSFGFMPIVLDTKFWHTQGWTALSVGVVP
jgi:hypothetical protein